LPKNKKAGTPNLNGIRGFPFPAFPIAHSESMFIVLCSLPLAFPLFPFHFLPLAFCLYPFTFCSSFAASILPPFAIILLSFSLALNHAIIAR
jgi:hypothetical protein